MLDSGKISREKLSKNSNYPPFATVFSENVVGGGGVKFATESIGNLNCDTSPSGSSETCGFFSC